MNRGKVTEAYIDCLSNEGVSDEALDLLARFFDVNSDKMVDKKITVLRQVADGKKPNQIEGFYDVLEWYEEGTLW